MSKCKACKKYFERKRMNQIVCSYECSISYSKELNEKKKAKEWQKEKKVIEEKNKSLSGWQKDLQKEINTIVRLIDKGSGCISCNGQTTPAGGHYHSTGSNRSITFHLDNIHLQDFNCNNWKSANLHKYDLGLIERYSKQYWEYVKFDIPKLFPLLKMAKNDYAEKIKIARQIVKELQKADLTYPTNVRLELRKKYNERLGIYN